MNKFEKWCNDLKQFWQSKDIDKIIDLFDKDIIYYETPNTKINSVEEIRKMWEEIKEQNTNDIELRILCVNNNKCIANYILNDSISYDMIYEIELNNENKCTYFKQWYMEY